MIWKTLPEGKPAEHIAHALQTHGILRVGDWMLIDGKIWKFHWREAFRAMAWLIENGSLLEIVPHKHLRLLGTHLSTRTHAF